MAHEESDGVDSYKVQALKAIVQKDFKRAEQLYVENVWFFLSILGDNSLTQLNNFDLKVFEKIVAKNKKENGVRTKFHFFVKI